MPGSGRLADNERGGTGVNTKTYYRIANWKKYYETNNSGLIKVNNKHEGKEFNRIIAHEERDTLFATWILILQISSKCAPRGYLVDSDTMEPLDPEDMSASTGFPVRNFEIALAFFSSKKVGWIEKVIGLPDARKMEIISGPSKNIRKGEREGDSNG